MKFLASLLLVVALSFETVALKPRRFVTTAAKDMAIHEKAPTQKTLELRGGGSEIAEKATAFWIVYNAMAGVLAPAPNLLSNLFGWNPTTDYAEGSFGHFCFENVASTWLGSALMVYLSVFEGMDVTKAVAYGTMPCAYGLYKAVLNDALQKFGCPKGFGAVNVALMLVYYYGVFVGDFGDNLGLLAKVVCLPPAINGLLGTISVDAGKSALMVTEELTDRTACAFQWLCRVWLLWGIFALGILLGFRPQQVLAAVTGVYFL